MILYYLSGFMMFILSLFMFFISLILLINNSSYFMEWNVMILNSVNLNFIMLIDWISILFIFVILLISSMIMLYCCEYMSHDNYKDRFFYLVFLFILSMLLMIISPNMVSILIGWDGLGLISYCLVIYYQNVSSFNSGMLTILLNRIGDVMILLSISMLFISGSWNFTNLNKSSMILLFLIIISAFTKSAQFPFSSWLPAAMAAPTPVSSLVHSSTLVTSGVYLLIRFHYMIFTNEILLNYIIITGLLTMMFAGLSANFEFDVKKIIAYSTLSQLGLMMMIFGFKNWELSYFHLVIHAMFKSMMFMCSGILIHSMLNYQDIRYMGEMKFYNPMTLSMLLISNLSLCGMPFMSGFYSKDQILENMFLMFNNYLIYLLLLFSTGLTVAYSIRMMMYLMSNKISLVPMNSIKDFELMNYPMMILMILSIIFGSCLNWILFSNIEVIFLLFSEKISIIIICFISLFLGKLNYKTVKISLFYFLKTYFGKMWFMYNFIPLVIINPFIMSKNYSNNFDKGWSEIFFKYSINLFLINLNKFNWFNNNIMFMMLSLSMFMLLILMLL
uniref:NADH-ubiquinone oxidoreductase chain 5 n=1 Tax=Apocrypta bakeri TaxID=490712 RepID=A0A8A1S255_APOBA|nr:NADH dehydrogenase subunit 5 [Apocrypta bakeri]